MERRTRAKVLKIDKNGTGFTVTYETPKGTEAVDCDLVVHATGRVPNIDHLNLDAAGVEYSRRGIKVSPFLHRKSVVEGKTVSVRVKLGGRRIIKNKKKNQRRKKI